MTDGLNAPGLGERRHELVAELKRRGPTGVAALADHVGLNAETVREHLSTLVGRGLVERVGTRRVGRGRPEVLYGISEEGQRLFPSRESELVRFMARHLEHTGQSNVLRGAIDAWIAEHRDAAMERLEGLEGKERVRAAAELLTRMGFMAELDDDDESLTLCHCPLRNLVEVSRLPCRAEISLVAELLGERPYRTSWIPDGDRKCSYRLTGEAVDGNRAEEVGS